MADDTGNEGNEGTENEGEKPAPAKTFSQEEVNGFVAGERRKHEDSIATISKERDDAVALRTQSEERLKGLEDDLNSTKQTALKYGIALDKGLPRTVAERLVGDNEDALTKDADSLAELLKGDGKGQLAGGPTGRQSSKAEDENDMNALIRKRSGRG